MTKERLKYLLDRYLDNSATEQELAEYNAWYQQQQDKGVNLFEQEQAATEYTDNLYHNINTTIQQLEKKPKGIVRSLRIYQWIAAAAVVGLVSSLLWYWAAPAKKEVPIAVVHKTPQKQLTRFTNYTNMVKQVSLPDGSSIELSTNSEVYYDESFGQQQRELWLAGKAFFKVAKDSARPFIVYSRALSTTALGTSFTITAYPDSVGVKIVLHTGKVVVKQMAGKQPAAMKPVYLTPGQEVMCDMAKGIASVKQTPLNELALRKKAVPFGGRTGFAIAFDQKPLADVLDSMAKGYEVSIKYNRDAMKDMVFTGIIRKTDSLSQVLQRMAALHNLKIVSTTKGYNVYSNL